METLHTAPPVRGLWNHLRNTRQSKEAVDMMRIVKQESRLTNLQRRQTKSQRNGAALHTSSAPAPRSASKESIPKWHSQKRSAESCRAGNSYIREQFKPGPTRDLEKEKRRLQSLMATGKEEPLIEKSKKADASGEIDRYQEVLNEIEERRQFLEDMASLGQETKYISIINNEISQKIRELELLEKTRTSAGSKEQIFNQNR